MTARPSRSDRFYALLLRLYPREFRERYGRVMRDFHRDRVAIASADGESMALLWFLTILDVVTSAAAEHLRPFLSGDAVMETLLQDLSFSLRSLRRRPAFTAIVVATIALGVGANAAIFSVVSGILIRPLPYPRAEQLFTFGHEAPTWLASDADFLDYKREMKTLSGLAAYTRRDATLSTADRPIRIRIARGTDDFFPLLGVKPMLGRTFVPDEFVARVSTVMVLSHSLWMKEFGADPSVVGRKVIVEGAPRTVVGVMPPNFGFPSASTDAWLPLPRLGPGNFTGSDANSGRTNHYLFMVGRFKDGASLPSVLTEAQGVARRIMKAEPQNFDPANPLRPTMKSVSEEVIGKTRPYLISLLGAVALVLLIACANVANLLLVRGEARRKEMALRSALGASGKRLTVQLLTESFLLAGAGAALGLMLAWASNRALVAAAPASVPRVGELTLDWRVLTFTALVAAVTGLLVGIVPAWRGSKHDLASTLKEGGKTTGTDAASGAARHVLVVAEIALAVTMLSGAGMLLRSLWHLQSDPLGFEPKGVLTAKIALPPREYPDERAVVFLDQLLAQLRSIPGVRAAGASGWLPVADAGGLWGYQPENGQYPDGRWPSAVPQQATPGYFKAIGLPLIAGREFTSADRADAELVAVVSKSFADLTWPGQNPIGQRFKLGGSNPPLMTIVGVVPDIHSRGFGDKREPTFYFPYAQATKSAYVTPKSMALLIRTDGNPLAIAEAVRKQVLMLDRSVPLSEVRTLERVVGQSVAVRKFNTLLLAGFAALALLLAGIGTYGVISYGVTQRRFEIGVRMALGAADGSVLALVLSEGMRLAVIGLGLGLVASIAVGRSIRAMLVGVGTFDATSLSITTALLLVVALAASLVPARRALRVSPLEALRSD
jgi:putative ABC transport system permease protein